ncbi:transposase [Sphingomonas aquatilis]
MMTASSSPGFSAGSGGSEEKVRIVEKMYLPGWSVSLVARWHGIGAGQLFTYRQLVAQGALIAAGASEEAVPASKYRALCAQVSKHQRLFDKKTMEAEILREAVSRAAGSNCYCARPTSAPRRPSYVRAQTQSAS